MNLTREKKKKKTRVVKIDIRSNNVRMYTIYVYHRDVCLPQTLSFLFFSLFILSKWH